ncbi:MAG: hypothetical protein JXL97_08520 [Bacteroidales bacterium]|nr:hypothetical protein [Bacteroidales bacterium]
MKVVFVFVLVLIMNCLDAQIAVFSDFENGNVEFVSADSVLNKLVVRPSLVNEFNTTRCWFNFGITGFDTTRNLTIDYFYTSSVIGAENPVFSYDQKNWERLEADFGDPWSKEISHKFTSDTVFFATGYPYTYTDVLNFVDSLTFSPFVDTSTLVISEGGRRVPMFIIKDSVAKPTDLVWITGRQHAFETTMNYTLEGMISFLISDDKKAVEMRQNTIIYVIPMMDVDNVFIGASGRMQKPVDFNRDWSENPHWKAVKKVQELIAQTNEMFNYRVYFDVHSTYPGTNQPRFGIFNEYDKDDDGYKKIKRYFKIFSKNAGYELDEIQGEMKGNYSDAYSGGIIYPHILVSDFSTTIECDWTTNHNGKPLTQEELRRVGELIAESLCDYLAD